MSVPVKQNRQRETQIQSRNVPLETVHQWATSMVLARGSWSARASETWSVQVRGCKRKNKRLRTKEIELAVSYGLDKTRILTSDFSQVNMQTQPTSAKGLWSQSTSSEWIWTKPTSAEWFWSQPTSANFSQVNSSPANVSRVVLEPANLSQL